MSADAAVPSGSGPSLWQRAQAELTQKERDQLTKAGVPTGVSSPSTILTTTKDSLNASVKAFQDRSLTVTLPSRNGAPRKVLLRDVFRRAADWLNIATSVGDKFIQFDASGHAALPWAGVKLLVELVTADVKKYDGVLEGIGTIVHNLTFYGEWQRLYASRTARSDADRLFEDALVHLYAAILRYQAAALKYFDENRLIRIGKGISSGFLPASKLQGQLDGVVNAEAEVSKITRLLDADLLQQIDANLESVAGQIRDLDIAQNESTNKILDAVEANAQPIHAFMDYVESQKLVDVLNWYSIAPFQSTHDGISEKIIPGTGAWLLNHDNFRSWKDDPRSGIFWLHGTMGMGKTSLASVVIQDLEASTKSSIKPSNTAYFYLVRDSGRTSIRDVLSTLARQLAAPTAASTLLKQADEFRETQLRKGILSASELATEKVRRIMEDLASQYTTVYLVIDALDESEDAAGLQDAVETTIRECPTSIKVFLTSRDFSIENPGLPELYAQHQHISIREGRQSGDIASFVDVRMTELVKKRKLLGSVVGKDKDELAAKLRSTILAHADGMFRWAEMRLIELCGVKYRLKSSILKALNDAPQALSGIYDNIYNSLHQDGETTESRLAKAMICWMIHCRQPLEKGQLMTAIRTYCDAGLEEDEVNEDLVHSLLPGFFQVVYLPTNRLGMFEFAHLSVREHYENHRELTEDLGQTVLAVTCLRKLNTYAKDFQAGTLSTIVDIETWKEDNARAFDSSEDACNSDGSVIIAYDIHEMLELRDRRKRRKIRLQERRRRQNISDEPQHSLNRPGSSSSSSDLSTLSEDEAVLSARYVRIGPESDLADDNSISSDLDVCTADDENDIQRLQESEIGDAAWDHEQVAFSRDRCQHRSLSVDDTYPHWLQTNADATGLDLRPRSYSSNDAWLYEDYDLGAEYWRSWDPSRYTPVLDIPYEYGTSNVYTDSATERSPEAEQPLSESAESFEESDLEELDLKRYPLVRQAREKWRRLLKAGEISHEEVAHIRYDIIRAQLLKYARMNWHVHIAKCSYDQRTLEYHDLELSEIFQEFCNVQPTEDVVVKEGLPFALWYDWLRQDRHSLALEMLDTVHSKTLYRFEKRRQKDRWLIRLHEICKFAGIEPGCRIATNKLAMHADS